LPKINPARTQSKDDSSRYIKVMRKPIKELLKVLSLHRGKIYLN
jgi:hypothetical protein